MSPTQPGHAPGGGAASHAACPDAGEWVMAVGKISDLLSSCDGRVRACSPGDAAFAEGLLPVPPSAIGHRHRAGEDSASVPPSRIALQLAAFPGCLGRGGVPGLLTSAARVVQ